MVTPESRADTLIRELAEADFRELVQFTPPLQQDAFWTARFLELPLRNVARLRGGDIRSNGLYVRGEVRPWPNAGKECSAVQQRLLSLREHLRNDERVFDSYKPVLRVPGDLASNFLHTKELRRQAWEWNARVVDARLPSFVLLGAPKCATTWLYDCLAAHPDVYVPAEKELEYFGSHRFHLGINWYKSSYTEWTNERVAGDTSVGYFDSPEAPPRLAATFGRERLKLILLLREPVDRAVSYYSYRLQTGNAPASFEKSLEQYYFRQLYIESGHYDKGFERYLQYFERNQILVLLYEQIKTDPIGVIRSVFDFLDVEPSFCSPVFSQTSNVGRSIRNRRLHLWLHHLGAAVQAARPSSKLGRRVQRSLNWINQRLNFTNVKRHVAIDEQILQQLREEFAPSNQRLANLANVDLSLWEASQSRRAA